MKNVFLSYRSSNVAYVKRLAAELDNNNISIWFDKNVLHDYVGDAYTDNIHNGIDESEMFLLIYTKDVENSEFIIEEELKYAISRGKRILFYPQEDIDLRTSKLKDLIGYRQWIDTKGTALYQSDTQESIHDEIKKNGTIALTKIEKGFTNYEDENIFLIRLAIQRILGQVTPYGNYTKLCGCGQCDFYQKDNIDIKVLKKAFFLSIPEEYVEKLKELKFFRKDKMEKVEKLIATICPERDSIIQSLYAFFENNKQYYTPAIIHVWLQNHLEEEMYKDISIPCEKDLTASSLIDIVRKMTACSFIHELEQKKTMFNGAELGVYSITDNRTINSESPTLDVELYYSDYFTFKCMTELFHILYSIEESPFIIKSIRDVPGLAPFLCSIGLGGFVYTNFGGNDMLLWTKRSDAISSGDMWHFSFDETVSVQNDAVTKNDEIHIPSDGCVRIDSSKILKRALKEELGITETLGHGQGVFEIGIIQSERLEIELIASAHIKMTKEDYSEGKLNELWKLANDGYLEVSKLQFLPLYEKKRLVGKFITPESFEISKRMQKRIEISNTNVGAETLVEENSFIDKKAVVGHHCRIHRNVFIDKNVSIGNFVKIQNNNSIYEGVVLEDGVFVGTNVCFTNDKYPRAINTDGSPVTTKDWILEKTIVKRGASIGAGAVILCGVTIGEWAMVGAGAVVVSDVPAGATVVGNPAKIIKMQNNR